MDAVGRHGPRLLSLTILADLEAARAEQGARVQQLKRDGADRAEIDAAVAELLSRKAVLQEALEHAAAQAQAAGEDARMALIQERLAALAPRPSGSGASVRSQKKKAAGGTPSSHADGDAAGGAPAPPFDRAAEWTEFVSVRKNRDACIHWVLRLAQVIERGWEDAPVRLARLALLRECLDSLREHAHADCRELGALAPRMLHSLDFEERHFLNLLLPIERKWSRGLRDDEFLVTTDDAPAGGGGGGALHQVPLVLVLDHLRSAFNVGAIFRTAECLGAARLVLCGYTATPDDTQVRHTTMGMHAHVAWSWAPSAEAAIAELRAAGTHVVALETVAGAPHAHEYSFPCGAAGCALLLGNERHGLAPPLLAQCDGVVRLPCRGVKNSLNVGVALGMCGHEILRQWLVRGDVEPTSMSVPS